MPKVAPAERSEMTAFEFTARDGLVLRGYLTLPKSTQGKQPPPLIVNPHGGPIGPRDHWGYNGEVQLLAEAGFAVLQVNFRGSEDSAKPLCKLAIRRGARRYRMTFSMQPTGCCLKASGLRAGVYIRRELWGLLGFNGTYSRSDLFKCAIGFVGVYDLPMLYERGDVSERDSGVAFMKKIVGTD